LGESREAGDVGKKSGYQAVFTGHFPAGVFHSLTKGFRDKEPILYVF
jgi:hypothetical protein